MEREESMKQSSIPFRITKIVTGVAKLDDSCPAYNQITHGDQDSTNKLASQTPEKPEHRSRVKATSSSILKGKLLSEDYQTECMFTQTEIVNSETTNSKDSLITDSSNISPCLPLSSLTELPEKYKTLSILFDRMDSSIRLLALHKRLPTFQNISTQVEILSKRKFLCSHLAQMKYAFPGGIQIERILIHDEKSLCMVPDMKITLVQDVVESHLDPDQSVSMALRKAFHARLLDFFDTHPEDTDIPHAELPEPFNQGNHIILNTLLKGSSKDFPQDDFADAEFSSSASHFSLSFHKQFSQKLLSETQATELLAFPAHSLSISMDDEDMEERKNLEKEVIQHSDSCVKSVCTPSRMFAQCLEITPAKYSSTMDKLMIETPALQTPKRPMPSTEEKCVPEDEKSLTDPKSASSVRRSLIYSPSKADGSLTDLATTCTPTLDTVHQYSCEKTTATRSILGGEIIRSPTNQLQGASDAANVIIKEKNMDHTAQAKQFCLLDTFDTICCILRSADCSFITKQELVHKIILNNLDIEETREVEEQLQLLEELVPDWISKRAEPSGDCLYSIKKNYDRESVRARLVEVL